MEAFESFVAVVLEAEGWWCHLPSRFPVRLKTRRADYDEVQTHGYEVDLQALGQHPGSLQHLSVRGSDVVGLRAGHRPREQRAEAFRASALACSGTT